MSIEEILWCQGIACVWSLKRGADDTPGRIKLQDVVYVFGDVSPMKSTYTEMNDSGGYASAIVGK
jgi:hypothetical protein